MKKFTLFLLYMMVVTTIFVSRAAAQPTITVGGFLPAMSSCAGTPSSAETFTVSANSLTGAITVTAPAGFEVSLSPPVYNGSVSITPIFGLVGLTTIYVRLKSTASGTPNGNITIASTGAATQSIPVSGSVPLFTDQAMSISPASVCAGGSGTVTLASSQIGMNYTMHNAITSAVIGTAKQGTGGALTFPTNSISSATTYKIVADNNHQSALAFGGSGSSVTNSSFSMNPSSGFTVEGWLYMNSSSGLNGFASQGQGLVGGPFDIYVNNGTLSFWIGNGSLSQQITYSGLTGSTWYHIACVYDAATSQQHIYVGGTLVASGSVTRPVATVAGSKLILGSRADNGFYLNGKLDDMRFWNVARTGSQISTYRNSCLVAPQSGLSAYYRFDDYNGSTQAADASGNGFNGTLNGSTSWTSGVLNCTSLCMATMSTTVTLQIDQVAPVVITKNISVALGGSGTVSISAGQVNNGSSDNCGIASMSVSPSTFTCANIGNNTVTLTVSDAQGNTSTGTAVVTITGSDIDGDNIADACDADDDNDGITDAMECNKSNFYWSNPPSISGNTATGFINGIGYTYTSSSPVQSTSGVYSHATFPSSYGVPNANPTIKNVEITNNTLTFASPMTNPVLVFASIGNSGNSVPITFSAPIQIVWSQSVVLNSSTQITGTEGYAIIRFVGTFSSISFNYLVAENWCNFAFGADFQSCGDTDNDGTPDFADTDSDNDGCLDAIEGSAGFTTAQILNGRLTGSVAANGIPVVAGAGQGLGTSQAYAANCICQPGNDHVPPTVIPKTVVFLNLGAAGSASITAAQVDSASSDACGILSRSIDKTTFTCADVGFRTVNLTVTDNQNNAATRTAIVQVIDNIAPTVVTRDVTVSLDANGTASITPAQVNNGSSDQCGIASVSLDKSTFNCNNAISMVPGVLTARMTVDNQYTIYISDDNNIQGTAFGSGVNWPTLLTHSTNLVPGKTYYIHVFAEDVGGPEMMIGDFFVTGDFKFINGSQTMSTTAANWQVSTTGWSGYGPAMDVGPNGTSPWGTYPGVASGARYIWRSPWNNAGSAVGYFTTPVIYTGAATTVLLTVTDVNGNSSSAPANINVLDEIAPTITCPSNIQTLAQSAAGAVVNYPLPTATDNCSATLTRIAGPASGSLFPIGVTTITYKATDAAGNTSTCSFNVTITGLPPMIVSPGNQVAFNANGMCKAPVFFAATETQGIPASVITYSHAPGSIFPVGVTTVTATATNAVGSSSTTFTVTVKDNEAPVVHTQNATIALDANGNASINTAMINNGSTDNCGIASISLDQTGFNCANVGPNTVILTVTDIHGNSASASATVYVKELIAPTVVTQSITVLLDANGNASITAGQINNGSSDNCAIASYALDKTSFDCSNVGANTVTLTATDVNGNSASQTATVTVKDLIAPTVGTQDITVLLDANGAASITTGQINYGSTDNCAIASYALDKTSFDCSNVGANTVTLTVTDVNGNSASQTATVTVKDLSAPTVVTQNITILLDASGAASITTGQINNGSTDNCAIASYALDKTNFDCSNVGANTVTLTATDVNGNSASQTATVTVKDAIAPTVVTQNITILLDANGAASITNGQINNGSTDNCAIASYALDKTNFDCSNVGANTVTLTATDVNGNSASQTATVTVKDLSAPTVVTQNITILLDASGTASITTGQINNGSTDNCAIASYALDKTNFDCSNVGTNTVTLTATDVNGNSASQNASVIVKDLIAPVVVTQNVTVTLSNGSAGVTASQVNNGSNDACGIASMSVSPASFSCGNIGANTVTLTVTDVNGNTSTGTATVNVIGVVPTCSVASSPNTSGTVIGGTTTLAAVNQMYIGYGPQSMNITCSASGGAPFTYSWSGTGLSNTAIANPVFTPTSGGNYTLICTVTNAYGCQTTCRITICVLDIRVPGGSPNNQKVYLCHVPPGNPNNPQTLSISINAVPAHLGNHAGDRLGSCSMSCGYAKTDGVIGEIITEESPEGPIDLIVYPNPSQSSFNLELEGNSTELVQVTVYDMSGRIALQLKDQDPTKAIVIDQLTGVGVFLAEVKQGAFMKVVKLNRVN